MATEYHPLPRNVKHKWLLTNGQIAEEPALEQSESGRRVRVVGDKSSVYAKDLDDLIARSIKSAARRMGEDVWMRCDETDPVTLLNALTNTPQICAAPHWVTPQTTEYRRRVSRVSWTFRHESLPISARITVEMSTTKPHYRNADVQHESVTQVQYLSTNPYDSDEPVVLVNRDGDLPFGRHSDGSTDYERARQNFADFLRDNSPEWMDLLGSASYGNEREAAAAIARLCAQLDRLDSIEIPDLRHPEDPKFISLGIYDTTYSREFAQGIIDYLNGQPLVDQMMEHWSAMVDLFRRTGIVVDELEESDFHAAINGDKERLNINMGDTAISTPDDEDEDTQHVVGFNLLTGTVTVSCSIRDMREEAIATDYEIARIKAEAQGELDAFLGYHAGYLGTQHEARHHTIVKQRSVDADEVAKVLGVN